MKSFPIEPNERRDLADLLKGLCARHVRFAVVGAWAVIAHTGKARATKDIDIYVASDDDNLRLVLAALSEFGAPESVCSLDALRPREGVNFSGVTFGRPPNRVDLLSKMEVPFAALEGRLVSFDLSSTAIPIAAAEDLLTLKRIALRDDPTRKTDKADIKALESLLPEAPQVGMKSLRRCANDRAFGGSLEQHGSCKRDAVRILAGKSCDKVKILFWDKDELAQMKKALVGPKTERLTSVTCAPVSLRSHR